MLLKSRKFAIFERLGERRRSGELRTRGGGGPSSPQRLPRGRRPPPGRADVLTGRPKSSSDASMGRSTSSSDASERWPASSSAVSGAGSSSVVSEQRPKHLLAADEESQRRGRWPPCSSPLAADKEFGRWSLRAEEDVGHAAALTADEGRGVLPSRSAHSGRGRRPACARGGRGVWRPPQAARGSHRPRRPRAAPANLPVRDERAPANLLVCTRCASALRPG